MSRTLQLDSDGAYQALRRQLLERIVTGQFPAGTRFHSVRDVAQWPGATAHLAQRALAELCRDGYLESVPKKGLFVRSGAKRASAATPVNGGERPHAAKLVLFLIPPGSNQSRVNEMLPIAAEALDPEVWRMEVVYLRRDYDAGGGFRFAELLVGRRAAAVVWVMPQPSDQLLVRYLVAAGVPVVTYNRDFTSTGAMGVLADVSGAAAALFERLLDQGKQRFAVLSIDRPSPSIRQFPDAVAMAAAARGLPLRHVKLPFDDDATFPNDVAAARVHALLDSILHPSAGLATSDGDADGGPFVPDAVLCAESYSLHAVEAWLAQHPAVRVPEDLAIASFDRIPTRHVVRVLPPIPRADFDNLSMMRTAMEMIEQDLSGRRVDPKLRHVPAVLID